MNDIEKIVREQARAAKKASRRLAVTSSAVKDAALRAMADALEKNAAVILAANDEDMAAAREKGTPNAMLDRLMLDEKRIRGMADGLRQTLRLLGFEPDLHGVVAVLVLALDLHDRAGADLEDGHRDAAPLGVPDLGHADLLAN